MNKNFKIIKKLIKKNYSIATAESCTGGLVGATITAVNGSSKIYKLGLITYSNLSKLKQLKVPSTIIKKYGAVSEQCCKSMLNGLSKISKTKINISITGIAGPSGGTKKKPIGTVYIGIKFNKKTYIFKNLFFPKRREIIRKKTIKKTFDLLNRIIFHNNIN